MLSAKVNFEVKLFHKTNLEDNSRKQDIGKVESPSMTKATRASKFRRFFFPSANIRPAFKRLKFKKRNIRDEFHISRLDHHHPELGGKFTRLFARTPRDQKEYLDWNFNVLEVTESKLKNIIVAMFQDLSVIERSQLEIGKLKKLVDRVCNAMKEHNNPYHNLQHVAEVVHSAYMLLKLGGQEVMSAKESTALMFAALGHDYQHPGYNNAYAVNTNSVEAQEYGKESPLERFHFDRFWRCCLECAVFEHLPETELNLMRDRISAWIVGTDMQKHKAIHDEFKLLMNNVEASPANERNVILSQNMELVGAFMLKAADISNPTKEFTYAEVISNKVFTEFFAQGDLEKAKGLPVSVLMDRETINKANASVGFIQFVVAPLYTDLVRLLPKLKPCLKTLLKNKLMWEERIGAP